MFATKRADVGMGLEPVMIQWKEGLHSYQSGLRNFGLN